MIYTRHARDRMAERSITEADVEWAIQSDMRWTDDGNRLYSRWYTAASGREFGIYVVLAPNAARVVTVWWQSA